MNIARKLMCWLFAISSVLCLWNAVRLIEFMLHRHDAFRSLRSVLIAVSLPALAAIYSVAWWTNWKEKRSARGWGIAASLTLVLLSLAGILDLARTAPASLAIMLAIGILGLGAFLWRRGSQMKRVDCPPET